MLKLSGIGKRRILKSFFRKLNAPYRLKINSQEDNDEILNLDLTKKSAYLLISSFIVGSFILVSILFLLTPIKYYIPGFETNSSRKKILALSAKVDSLSGLYRSREAYLTNIVKVTQGDDTYILDTINLDKDRILSASVRNSGAIDDASKYKHLLGRRPKVKNDTTTGTSQKLNKETPVIEEEIIEKPKKKHRDTIIIRK